MKVLIVYRTGEQVGRLEQDDDESLRFVYDPLWLKKAGAVALSRSLPLQDGPFSEKKTRPFFAGILPEEGPRRLIARILGISDRNDFALLERIGGECAGAVVLLPEGTHPVSSHESSIRHLSEQQLQQIVAELPKRPLMAGSAGIRLSLAGAQSKLPVVIHGDEIGLPLGDTPSTHILKPEPAGFPGLALNEWFCMTLAKSMGLHVAPIEFRVIGSTPCVLVQRYDRWTDEIGSTVRIHQEDFCQALGRPPERKYQAEGGPTVKDCVGLLREWSTAPALDVPAFVNGLLFNVLIGNADAHGKNFSFLYPNGDRRLAPLYDLVSTIAWPELSTHAAMKIGNCESINVFSSGDWKNMVKATGLGWPMIRERMVDLCQRAPARVGEILVQAESLDATTAKRMETIMRDRSATLLACALGTTGSG